jgi:hypothetical protein
MPGKHNYPYRKGVDITAWVLQLLVCLILIGFSAYLLAVTYAYVDDYYEFSDVSAVLKYVLPQNSTFSDLVHYDLQRVKHGQNPFKTSD